LALLSCNSGGGGGGGGGGNQYSVSGTISAADNSAIDSDVNDPNVTPEFNDTFDDAQELPNPVILGGYVNETGTGEEGNFYDADDSSVAGDLKDYYSVSLTENQSITLYISDGANIDLFLYDATETEIDQSAGTESIETVSPDETGSHYIEVRAIDDASSYILVVGEPNISATTLDPRMDLEYMPGHVIVAFKENAEPFVSKRRSITPPTYKGMIHKAMNYGDIGLYKFANDNKNNVFSALQLNFPETNRALYQTTDPREQLKLDTLRVIDALNRDPNVRFAEPNFFRHPLFVPDDPEYIKQWHYPLINVPSAWDITTGVSNVIVAVIDTGILSQHPDIIGQLTSDGYDFISEDAIANDPDPGIDDDPEDTGDELQGGSSFHGTHVSGTVAAASNNDLGVAGIAFQSKIMPLRALGVGGGLTSDIMEAMRYAAGLDNDSETVPTQPADIINMSLGGGLPSQAEQEIIDDVRAEGVIIIAAAGNEETSAPSYPAAYNGVISVSAVGPDKSLSSYSNFGSTIDVAAPGGDFDNPDECVYSTSGDDTSQTNPPDYVYSYSCGTSMASPHMAGVVALMKSVYPDLTPVELDALLANGYLTEDLEADGTDVRNDNYGYGLIDALKAVDIVDVPAEIPTLLIVNPMSFNFDNADSEFTLTLTKSNNLNQITIDNISDNADWLEVTADSVDEDGLGTYLVTVDRSGIPDGPYSATITIESSQGDVDVPVIMYKNVFPVTGDTGYHYVGLIDPYTWDTIDVVRGKMENGTFAYNFPSVQSGWYVVFAGTNMNNDDYFGESGEARGVYISLDQPVQILVNQNWSEVDFSTHFILNFSTERFGYHFDPNAGFPLIITE